MGQTGSQSNKTVSGKIGLLSGRGGILSYICTFICSDPSRSMCTHAPSTIRTIRTSTRSPTPRDQPHREKSVFLLILWPMPPVKTHNPSGENMFYVCLAYRSTVPLVGIPQQALHTLRYSLSLSPSSVLALKTPQHPSLHKYRK